MPETIPFAALRYNLDHVSSLTDVVAPPEGPRDVARDSATVDRLYKRHPANVVRVIANRSEPGDEERERFERAGEFIEQWISEGVLHRDDAPAIYAFRQSRSIGGVREECCGWLVGVRIGEREATRRGGDAEGESTGESPEDGSPLPWMLATDLACTPVVASCVDPDGRLFGPIDGVLSGPNVQAADFDGRVHSQVRVDDPAVVKTICDSISSQTLRLVEGQRHYEAARDYRDRVRKLSGELPGDHPANFVLTMLVEEKSKAKDSLERDEFVADGWLLGGNCDAVRLPESVGASDGDGLPLPLAGLLFYPLVTSFRFDANVASS